MAQHYPIQNASHKGMQKVYQSIYKKYKEKGISGISGSLKFEEIFDDRLKESENDRVFATWRTINGKREIFEAHFDSVKKEIINIYLVK